jgi:hypothetical protein
VAKGVSLNDKTKEKIKALLSQGIAKNAIAKKLGVSWASVDKVSKEEPDNLESLREHKRQEFIDDLWDDIRAARILGRQKIDLATVALEEFKPTIDKLIELLSENEDTNGSEIIELIKALSSITSIPLSHISTYIGTLYDKQALMTGGKTADIGLSYEDRLKRIIGGTYE